MWDDFLTEINIQPKLFLRISHTITLGNTSKELAVQETY